MGQSCNKSIMKTTGTTGTTGTTDTTGRIDIKLGYIFNDDGENCLNPQVIIMLKKTMTQINNLQQKNNNIKTQYYYQNIDNVSQKIKKLKCHFDTIIHDSFLFNCNILVEFVASEENLISFIGNDVFNVCTNLINIDLSGMINVKSIGDNFLVSCINLVTFDTTGLTNLTYIGNNFMSDCKSLETIDTTGMINVKYIGSGFLSGCVKLIDFDVSNLKNIETIENDCFANCSPNLLIIIKSDNKNEYLDEFVKSFQYNIKKYYDRPIMKIDNR